MDPIPITSLTPEIAPPADKSIRAIVTLSWPYSSSTRQCALLLADPDFRLRNRKGQVRVRFTGASAEAVAKAHVGIGDEVVLALEGASWEQDSEATRTPGKSVDGELLFRRRLALSVTRNGGNIDIKVDAPVSPIRSPEKPHEVATPLPKVVTGLRSSLDGTVDTLPSYTYTSPAFVKRLRLSGESFLDSAYDPFAEGDLDTARLDERSWRNREWRYGEKTPSPKKVHFEHSEVAAGDHREEQELSQAVQLDTESPSEETPSRRKMPPPPLPSLQTPVSKPSTQFTAARGASVEEQEGPLTPTIRPVQSPTLPMPSPFPMDTGQARFGIVGIMARTQDRREETTDLARAQTEREGALSSDHTQDKDMEMFDKHTVAANEGVQEDLSDTEPDDELTQQTLIERYGITGDATVKEQQEPGTQTGRDYIEVVPEDDEDITSPHVPSVQAEAISETPRTPLKDTGFTAQLDLGLDGASSAPPSAHVTPQSERERVMAQTFRSLFGFRDPSETTSAPQQAQHLQQEPQSPSPAVRFFSDMARERLEAADVAVEAPPKASIGEAIEAPVSPVEEQRVSVPQERYLPVFEEQQPNNLLQEQSQIQQRQAGSSARPSEIEVVDLASSSEDDDERPREAAQRRPTPQRRIPQVEIQDSLADSEAEDLLAQESQSLHGLSGIRERRAQASKLQQMVAEEPERIAATPEDVAMDNRTETILATSPLSSLPPGLSELTSSHAEETTIDRKLPPAFDSFSAGVIETVSSPHGDPLAEAVADGLPEAGTLSIEAVSETVPPKSKAPVDVIEIGSSSPVHRLETGLVRERSTQDEIVEGLIEMDKLDPFTQIRSEAQPAFEGQSQVEVKSLTPSVASPTQTAPAQSQEQYMHVARQTMETPLYPSLPLSPSNSQSLQDMPAQTRTGILPDTMTGVLPPTPQLTQVESFTEPAMIRPSSSELEETDRLTQEPPQVTEDEPMSQTHEKTPLKKLSSSQLTEPAEEQLSSQPLKKTPARTSLNARLSNVPDVISAWFSPKRSSSAAVPEVEGLLNDAERVEKPEMEQVNGTFQMAVNGHTLAQPYRLQSGPLDTTGFSTALSYFTPLSRLDELLNPSSQQVYGTNAIDVLAVVTDQPKEPVRAKAGPRDYFTVFKISDRSLLPQHDFRVEIYRPWKATLPVASVGDIILLRAFAVKSRQRQPYLLSTDASAWCVWRYGSRDTAEGDDARPVWARKAGSFGGDLREEMKGPPVELGDEEREHASQLRKWWQAVESTHVQSHAGDDMSTDAGLNGHPIAARL